MAARVVQPSGKRTQNGKAQAARRQAREQAGSAARMTGKRPNVSSLSVALAMNVDEEPSWLEQTVRWLKSMAATGYGVSIVIHLLLLIALSLIVFTRRTPEVPQITSIFVNQDVVEFQEVELLTLEPLESIQPYNPADALAATEVDLVDSILDATSPGETEVAEAIGQSAGFQMPGGGRAVTKGSFTAWTVPEDPAPREDYLVVIQVRVPEKIRKYKKEDLSGFLEGDDGYETPLGNFTGKGFPRQFYGKFDDEARQFVIRIPGGAAKVHDRIQIRSKILREEQSLEITF